MTNPQLSLSTRLALVLLVTITALAGLLAGVLYSERALLLNDRKDKVRSLVESAHSVVAHFEDQARQGKMPVEAAQGAALAALRSMRYDNNEYFWVNDMAPKTLMHPIKPELEGKDMSGLKDPNGKYLFNEFVAVVRKDGKGFVDYFWPKPGEKDPVAKISYVMGFAPWAWVIGSGVYVDDVDRAYRDEALKFMFGDCSSRSS